MNMNGQPRQVRKTREALLRAFADLVMRQRYADIRVADIIRRADVGRSTFYEHFRNKDDLFRQSVSQVLAFLAEAVEPDADLKKVASMLEHFRENSRMARGLANSPCAPQMVAVLANLIEERLVRLLRNTGRQPILPLGLLSASIAEAQLGLVQAWLRAGAGCPAANVAAAMHRSTAALIGAPATHQRSCPAAPGR